MPLRRPVLVALAAILPLPLAAGEIWDLALIGAEAPPPGVTLEFGPDGEISGQGPCNRYFGAFEGPLPDFRPGPLGATKMACENLAAEIRFFSALSAAERAEIEGDTLTVTGSSETLVFHRGAAD